MRVGSYGPPEQPDGGAEWLATSGIAGFIYVNGYFQAANRGGSRKGLSLARTAFGATCYVAQIAGSIILMLGCIVGLYLAATAMIIFFASLISGAWLLLVGICDDDEALNS